MMAATAHFNGTQAESQDLVNAISRNCTRVFDTMGARDETCEAHKMLLNDQRALDGLLFDRRLRDRLIREEFSDDAPDCWP